MIRAPFGCRRMGMTDDKWFSGQHRTVDLLLFVICHLSFWSRRDMFLGMALTLSRMVELGSFAPDFSLPNPSTGKTVARDDFSNADALLVTFMCAHCPYVIHVKPALVQLGNDYRSRSVGIVGISSNDPSLYPADAPPKLARFSRDLPFPLLFDETQEIAKAYGAACTPDFFLFDQQRKLVYRGQLDDSRPGNGKPLTGKDLRAALDAVLSGKPVSPDQKASIGCSIKWKPGNQPS
jgi:peroxiredoxin